jgi:hypothetical protein
MEWKALMLTEDDLMDDGEEDAELSQGFYKQPDPQELDEDIAAVLPATLERLDLRDVDDDEIPAFVKLLKDKEQGNAAPKLTAISISRPRLWGVAPDQEIWEPLKVAALRAGVTFTWT